MVLLKRATGALLPNAQGDVVIFANLATHKSPMAAAILTDIGAWFPVLPPYSPDLNPIAINRALSRTNGVHALIFAKLKTLIPKAAARTCDQLWQAAGPVCNLFKAPGYETN